MRFQKHGFRYHLLDVAFNIVVIVAIVAGVRTFLVSPFQVEGGSMIDTLSDKEYIIINKFAFLVGNPSRGDVVVFRPPNDSSKYYVKRVIGMPSDTITIEDGFVKVKTQEDQEERLLDESGYLNQRNLGHTYRHPPGSGDRVAVVYEVPTGEYFLLGDNRQGSLDSRSFMGSDGKPTPFVKESNIRGRVWFIALPITKIHALEAPEYGL